MTPSTSSSEAISESVFSEPLYVIADVREITRKAPIFARSAMSDSVIPLARYSCSASPETLRTGRTTRDSIF